MKSLSFAIAFALVAVCAVGCSKTEESKPAAPSASPTQSAATPVASATPSVAVSVAAVPPVPAAEDDVPTAEDFEEEAENSIDPGALASQIDDLEKEIGK